MQTKSFEIRDEGTFIAILAVDMNPVAHGGLIGDEASFVSHHGQRYLLRRVGYPCDGVPNILITRLAGDASPASNDPYSWGGRTMPVAHHYIIENWAKLRDGDVIDVQFILGETTAPKTRERLG